jgi:hypothetical protein
MAMTTSVHAFMKLEAQIDIQIPVKNSGKERTVTIGV